MSIQSQKLTPFLSVLFLTMAGCAEFGYYNPPGSQYHGGQYHGGQYHGGQYHGGQYMPSAPVVAQPRGLPPIDRGQTGQSYNQARAQLLAWTAVERERRIASFLRSHPQEGLSAVRDNIKANIGNLDDEIARFRDSQSILGATPTSNARYSQLVQGRRKLQAELDAIDEQVVHTMLENQAANAARITSYTGAERQSIHAAGANAARAAEEASSRANEAFGNVNW